MSIDETVKEIKRLSKLYEVKTSIRTNDEKGITGRAGYSIRRENLIVIIKSKNKTADKIISTWFHELGHIHCGRNKIWKGYHIEKPIKDLDEAEKRRYIRTCLKAEYWVDRWAKKEMHKHYSELSFISISEYRKGYVRKFYHDNHLKYLRA